MLNNSSRLSTPQSAMFNSASVPANLNKYTNQQARPSTGSPSLSNKYARPNSKPKDRDEELFEFLNSDASVDNNSSGTTTKTLKPWNNSGLSRHSSSSSLASQRSGKTTDSTSVPLSAVEISRSDKEGRFVILSITDVK